MKILKWLQKILLLGLLIMMFTGCITSVHSLFSDDELVFLPELVGTWQENDETLIFSKDEDKEYSIRLADDSDTTLLIGRLGKLGNHYFLDMTIDPSDKTIKDLVGLYLFPVHIFFKVSFQNNELTMQTFAYSSDWLEKLIKERRIRIGHEVENDQVLLTASTEELQKFVSKYVDEPKAFDSETSQFKRVVSR